MNSLHTIYHIARADFLERVRRYSFLVMLMLVVFLGYQTAIGNLALELGKYRGEFNSAWVGAMMSLIGTFFIGWFGFYLVKGSVARDKETGVGQIMAATPMTRPSYLLGKWFSNFAVLMTMVTVLALAGIVIQFLQGESTQVNLWAFLSPFAFIVLPLMAVVAAVAVLFEAIPFLSGGFGNIIYFFAFIMFVPLFMENDTLSRTPAYEPMGLALLATEMGNAVSAIHPDYDGTFTLGGGFMQATEVFTWNGIQWTSDVIFARFSLILFALAFVFLGALFFDRFDSSRAKPKRTKTVASPSDVERAAPSPALPTLHLTPLAASARRFNFVNVLIAELKLLLKGQPWWWYAIAGGLIVAGIVTPIEGVRAFVLPAAWIWPILIWSRLGNREMTNNTHQMVFASAAPVWRQLPAQWLAGFLVTALTGVGVAINLLTVGDSAGLLAWISGALLIPSLALAFGVWSNTSKVFEIVYLTLWYIGPLNNVPAVDYLGAHGNGNVAFFIPLSAALIVAAFVGRMRQARG